LQLFNPFYTHGWDTFRLVFSRWGKYGADYHKRRRLATIDDTIGKAGEGIL
jgi:hypothetical protein